MAEVFYQFDMFEDSSDLKIFQRATDLYCALSEIDGEMRTRMKHGNIGDEEYNFLERMRTEAVLIHDLGN